MGVLMNANIQKMKLWLVVLLVLISGLTACASMPGPFNGNGSDVMCMIIIYRTDHKPLTKEQYTAVTKIAKEMGVQINWQLTGPFEAAASSGGAYALAGLGGGASQGMFYPGAMTGAAAGYSAVTYGLGGVVNGLVTASYAKTYAVAQATEMAMRDAETDMDDGAKILHRVHVVGAFVRSRNTSNSPAPELAKRMPDWHGPTAGTSEH